MDIPNFIKTFLEDLGRDIQLRLFKTKNFLLNLAALIKRFAFSTGRQPYYLFYTKLLGSEIFTRLQPRGYEINDLSWTDDDLETPFIDEILSLRRCYHTVDPYSWRQVHLRYYLDGELRGHDELAPEFDPQGHISGISLQEVGDDEKSRLKRILEGL